MSFRDLEKKVYTMSRCTILTAKHGHACIEGVHQCIPLCTYICTFNHPLQLEVAPVLDLEDVARSYLALTLESRYLLPGDIISTISRVNR